MLNSYNVPLAYAFRKIIVHVQSIKCGTIQCGGGGGGRGRGRREGRPIQWELIEFILKLSKAIIVWLVLWQFI